MCKLFYTVFRDLNSICPPPPSLGSLSSSSCSSVVSPCPVHSFLEFSHNHFPSIPGRTTPYRKPLPQPAAPSDSPWGLPCSPCPEANLYQYQQNPPDSISSLKILHHSWATSSRQASWDAQSHCLPFPAWPPTGHRLTYSLFH